MLWDLQKLLSEPEETLTIFPEDDNRRKGSSASVTSLAPQQFVLIHCLASSYVSLEFSLIHSTRWFTSIPSTYPCINTLISPKLNRYLYFPRPVCIDIHVISKQPSCKRRYNLTRNSLFKHYIVIALHNLRIINLKKKMFTT